MTAIPPKDSTFQIDITGELTKHRYIGEFKCRIANNKNRALIDKHQAFLNGELANQLSPETLIMNRKIAHLRFTLIEYPKWWLESDLGFELYDVAPVSEVYDKVLEAEREWYRQVWGDEALAELEAPEESENEPAQE